ncbi:lipopolysaccharide kinase InaA family protein [Kiritimatiellaeota bacterium B1221]|nr:lipopolysaccharide kinase InaA family protein [Kiritimatiellaeota bacterium B1221]
MSSGFPVLPPICLPVHFYREAGRACAHYVQNGGRLRDIRMDENQLLHSPLQLTPPPHGDRSVFPVRKELEEDLDMIEDSWSEHLRSSPRLCLRFLFAFCQAMERQSSGWKNWARIRLREKQVHHRQHIQQRYQEYLTQPNHRTQSVIAHWDPQPGIDAKGLKDLLEERLNQSMGTLSLSQRAVVIQSELLGQNVIIKRYAANPQSWKRKWEHSRARRAWAAANILEDIGLPAIQGLGWLEIYQQGKLQESYFISRQLTEMETLRTWLRREFPHLSASERNRFRHRLRSEILRLQDHGLRHVDLKLSNLLIKGREVEDLVFYWIDLEDLRVGPYSRRTFVRNLYQLNGSLPRNIPRQDRVAFARGFRNQFAFANSPKLMNYVQRKTRKRHQDELKRLQGA